MTDATAAVWVSGITCWLLITAGVTFKILTCKEREDVQMRHYISPGAAGELEPTPMLRLALLTWLAAEDKAALRAFRKQLERTKPGGRVTVYAGQVEPLCELAESKGLVSLSRALKGEE